MAPGWKAAGRPWADAGVAEGLDDQPGIRGSKKNEKSVNHFWSPTAPRQRAQPRSCLF